MARQSSEGARKLLAANIARTRKSKRWTQEEAASAIGIAVRHYQKLEAGQVNATISTLSAIAAAFHVSIARLFRPQS